MARPDMIHKCGNYRNVSCSEHCFVAAVTSGTADREVQGSVKPLVLSTIIHVRVCHSKVFTT